MREDNTRCSFREEPIATASTMTKITGKGIRKNLAVF